MHLYHLFDQDKYVKIWLRTHNNAESGKKHNAESGKKHNA
jgi:hypothetical protein